MPAEYQGSLKGRLLIAMPFLADPNFHKTVTCICAHDAAGALGVVINRQDADLTGKDIFSELKMESTAKVEAVPVYLGGPVHMDELFILHGPPFDWVGCHQITPTLAMSNTRDILESIAGGNGPDQYIIALGCAGWGGGQLEYEIKENTWMTSDIFEKAVFNWPVADRWDKVLNKNGIDPTVISQTVGHA